MGTDHIAVVAWRRRRLLALTFAALLLVVVVVTLALPKTYRATATMYVGSKGVSQALAFDTNLGERLARTYTTLAANPNVADQVRAQLPGRPSRSDLLGRMSFAPVERTQLLQIAAEAGSPALARETANTYAEIFARRVAGRFDEGNTQTKVSLSERAALPGSASKPVPSLYIGIGGILAAMAALGVVLARERFEQVVKVAGNGHSPAGNGARIGAGLSAVKSRVPAGRE